MKHLSIFLLAVCIAGSSFAQQGEEVVVDVNTTDKSNWYASPWVWILGAVIFILLLIAITRSGSRRVD